MTSRQRPRSRRRYALLAALTLCVSGGATLLVLIGIDLGLHRKYERTASVNIRGYRGPLVSRKQPAETRVAVFGGSTAFGYGPDWDGSFPYLLERRLSAHAGPQGGSFVVVNLAYNNDAAYSFRFTMEDYESLDYDIAILYEGYNDLGDEPRLQVFRRQSAVFRLTGYLPIFPLIFREKALALLYGGDIRRGYEGNPTVFRPTLASRGTSAALEAAAAVAETLEQQLGRLSPGRAADPIVPSAAACTDRWRHYCGAVYDAIRWARARGIGVLVGTQPHISDRHVDQQQALALLAGHFADDPGVVHVNLGGAVNLQDRSLAYDGMHLTPAGNAVIAEGFVEPVLKMALALDRRRPEDRE